MIAVVALAAALVQAEPPVVSPPAPATSTSAIVEPAAAPPAPVRPAIQFNRWEEDWSVLADPALRTGPLDALKYIPLSAADPKTYVSLGGSLRERFETNDAPSFGTTSNPADSYVISRLEAHADLRVGPVQAFVELQSGFAPGKKVKSAVDSDRLDLEQAFVALTEPLGGGILKLRAGRQQFAFDLQRFVAARDGPNVRQSFDALWADYEIGRWRVIGYYTRPVVDRDLHPFDDYSSSRNLFYGVRVERLVLGNKELSGYWSRFTNDGASFLTARGVERRDVWDMRFAGKTSRFDWDVEGMLQTGSVGSQRIRAWAFGSRTGYTFASAPLKPRLGIQFDGASGDKHPSDGTLGTFNPLFPNGYYVTLAGYTGYVNFLNVKPAVTLQPSKRLTSTLGLGLQWRETLADAVYTQPNIAVPRTAGTGGRWTGSYTQFRTDWQVNANLTAAVEAVHFAIGDTVRTAGGHDGNYLGVEAKYAW